MRILLVGSSGGIGSAVARNLTAAGHEVLAVDKEEPAKDYHLACHVRADLRDPSSALVACETVRTAVDQLWAIVYNAGVYHPDVGLQDYSLALWDEVNNINLRSAFVILSNLHALLVKGGRIVLVASEAARLGSRDVAYSASKSGLLGLMRSFATNLADQGIRVNAVCPGPIHTPMSGAMESERVEEYKKRILLGRFGEPEEVAVAVNFLLNPENTFMTGAIVSVSGGLHMNI